MEETEKPITYEVLLNGERLEITVLPDGSCKVFDKIYKPEIDTNVHGVEVKVGEFIFKIQDVSGRISIDYNEVNFAYGPVLPQLKRSMGQKDQRRIITAPIPGLISEVPIEPNTVVEKNELLVILEAMKMRNEIRAPIKSTIQQIHVRPGDQVDLDQIMVVLIPVSEGE
ncbi:MAG: biotin/lipoyl-containing protein [Candidatus Kariarchaeaceae archaeon]